MPKHADPPLGGGGCEGEEDQEGGECLPAQHGGGAVRAGGGDDGDGSAVRAARWSGRDWRQWRGDAVGCAGTTAARLTSA